jgi:flagellar protein FlaI
MATKVILDSRHLETIARRVWGLMTGDSHRPNGHDDGGYGTDEDGDRGEDADEGTGWVWSDTGDGDATPDGGVAAHEAPSPSPEGTDLTPVEEGGEDGPDADDERDGPYIDPEKLAPVLAAGSDVAEALSHQVGEHTVNVNPDLDEDAFFRGTGGEPTVVDRYHLEKAVPTEEKRSFREVERYWVNEPFAFVVLFHSEKENERKYYVIEPHLTGTEEDLRSFLTEKLTSSITYSWREGDDSPGTRATVIEEETYDLLSRYDIYSRDGTGGFDLERFVGSVKRGLGLADGAEEGPDGDPRAATRNRDALRIYPSTESLGRLVGSSARPESAVLAGDDTSVTEYQVEKLLYYLRRDFVGFERIDPIKHDVNVEDVSCDGYDSPVFVYHTDHEQLITNVEHGRDDLDDFVVKLAQRSGKGISKRQPQVDATLPDGSRAQLTLGTEVSDRGTNYTIRQFKDVPFTPIDLVNWHTFSLDQVALLWLCIENNKSIMFAGGTASGKTTSLNALSLFIPSNAKIVSIEDTREVELPQRNWVASVTRPSFATDDRGDIDEFDLLEAALRQRPDYLVMGEVRGEEGRTLFQMMSTGHTTYTTFHADSVGEVIDRFTTDPINVSKSLFTALDLVTVQVETRVQGRKVRRNRTLTEINRYDAELEEVNVQDVYRWQPDTDEFKRMVEPSILDEIQFDRGWDDERLRRELFERRVLLAYLVDRDVRTYAEVAAAIQGYISAPETIMGLIAGDRLDGALADLRSMENVLIDIDPEKEAMVPRPDPNERVREESAEILERAEQALFEEYEDVEFDDAAARLREAADFDWNTDNAPETLDLDAPATGPDDPTAAPAPEDPGRGPERVSELPDDREAREAARALWDLEGIEPLFEPAEGED